MAGVRLGDQRFWAAIAAAIHAMPHAAIAVGAAGRVVAWNLHAEHVFGHTAERAVGTHLDALGALGAAASRLDEVRLSCMPAVFSLDVRSPARDSTPVTIHVAPLAPGNAAPIGFLVSMIEQTEIAGLRLEHALVVKELEDTTEKMERALEELHTTNEELRVTNDQLEERVAELEAAQVADRHKNEFLAVLAHELRNPLAPIMSAVHVIDRYGGDHPLLRRARATIERQVRHQARLLEDLLDISRITRGTIELRKMSVDFAPIVADAVEATRALIDARRHTLSVAIPSEPVRLVGDPTRLTQVVANLLNNAARYTEPGGRISVAVERDVADVVLRVRDTGIGIPPEMLERIFELFAQADTPMAREAGGLGIGLTLVRQLVELHGGGVTAHSRGRGQGSEFVVRLPVGQPAAPTDAAESRRATAPPRRILVIEDDPDVREMFRLSLELEGHRVEVAEDGPRGIELARARRPEVVIVDIGLPGMDGHEVARRLRKELGERVALIALTGYGQDEDRRRTQEAGFQAHLVKPVMPEALDRALRETAP
jgi:signal transduction histidine kinase